MTDQRQKVAQSFLHFGEHQCAVSSPLYATLSRGVRNDPDLLAIAAQARKPFPNLFFAAVHWLLIREPSDPLAAHYPSIRPDARPAGDPCPLLRSFVLDRADAIRQIVTTRLVQTNETRRCGYLLPAFSHVGTLADGRPLALIEIGCSAGLNLCFDHYAYDYGDGQRRGDAGSQLLLDIEVRDGQPADLPIRPTVVAQRVGLDLNPIRADDADQVDWLRALIWPEHHDRRALFERALSIARHVPLDLRRGDAADLIEEALDAAPADACPCVFQTHALNQFPQDAVERLTQAFERQRRRRDFFFLSRHNRLELEHHRPGGVNRWALAECDGHGRWLAWRPEAIAGPQ